MAATPQRASNPELRELPSVEQLASELDGTHEQRVAAARAVIGAARERLLAGLEATTDMAALRATAAAELELLAAASLRPVINATGVVLHTNLGRAPLAPEAADAAAAIGASYSNLELDLEAGERGSRSDHVEPLLRELTGAEAAVAVNNNAAAVMLALAATAAGREVIVGRDQLVEIGGSFRIPEILALSGCELVEVGTTNRTRVADYAAAIGERTAALLRVHQSNFRTVGFTESPPVAELCELGAAHGLPVVDDLGSGALEPIGDEPIVAASLAAGAAITCFSADKLLGGPQAGILAGTEAAIAACRSHPLARALRIDKLQLAALEATLRLRRDRGPEALPGAAMLTAGEAELRRLAELIAELIGPAAQVTEGSGRAGGGTLPTLELTGPVCSVDPGSAGADELAARLRAATPAVVARIADGRLILDPRTLLGEGQARAVADAVRAALA